MTRSWCDQVTLDKGLIFALLTLLAWAFFDTAIRFSVSVLGAHPLLFTCSAQIGGAITLLMIARNGPLAKETLLAPHTWTHGLLNLLTTAFFVIGVSYITATEGTFLGRMDIILGLILPWIILKRKPHRSDWIGAAIIALGIGWITHSLPQDIRIQAFFAFLLNALFATFRTIEVERHPTSIKASNNIRDRCRVSGLVLIVVGLVFLIFSGAVTLVSLTLGIEFSDASLWSNFIASGTSLTHANTYISGLITGALTLAPAMFFYMYSTLISKTEKFLMMGCFLPFLTFAVEYVCSLFGLLDISSVTFSDLIAGGLIVVGSIYMISQRQKKEKIF